MLFNSFPFIFIFLPIALIGFFRLGAVNARWGAGWLALVSLFFYGWWNPTYVVLLLISIVFNYNIGRLLTQRRRSDLYVNAKTILFIGVAADLALLSYYKYSNFFLTSVGSMVGWQGPMLDIVLPLGISFYTFTQIAFLVDAYQGKANEQNFIHYCLFVTYFPHLIAGPVLHHKEMMPQFASPAIYRLNANDIAVGLTFFAIGLFKKAVLADGIAPYANAGFSSALSGQAPGFLDGWGTALAYSFQLYFDFSGYSDMAIGLSRLFGIWLPFNFNSPYKARNIVEFWRRWHMTLSRFLRDYLYVPLGGNRKGTFRRYFNLFLTMLLGGLWHGAGWTFVIWGGLHGIYLMLAHAWGNIRLFLGWQETAQTRVGRAFAYTLTFIAVVFGWVFFRASTLDCGLSLAAGMIGLKGVSLPTALAHYLSPFIPLLEKIGVEFSLGAGTNFVMTWIWVIALAIIAFVLPNTQQFLGRVGTPPATIDATERFPNDAEARAIVNWHWSPNNRWAAVFGILLAAGLLTLSRVSEFLYFQF